MTMKLPQMAQLQISKHHCQLSKENNKWCSLVINHKLEKQVTSTMSLACSQEKKRQEKKSKHRFKILTGIHSPYTLESYIYPHKTPPSLNRNRNGKKTTTSWLYINLFQNSKKIYIVWFIFLKTAVNSSGAAAATFVP